ncbi:hypothetical protein QVD17_11352 [Tagetes erecta]|uniref:SOSEKI DIX-like domain-containing protein n=1 Tax=Tagetes erecta TaxID=13708 RepID=A0AAD8KTA6_TARER|nr:hypothetical protein QVD17_11352 [Tagetes erecta]
MEGRVRLYGHHHHHQQQQQLSPDRAKVWKERSPKYQQRCQPEPETEPETELQLECSRKVPVVYYLCKNRQLEHPHFIEVTLTSSEGLFLRDVIEKLNVLRGRGMVSMYSWSCKRSYKNGFVWHDLCEDDLILPANGNEYVLKGSELVEESNQGCFAPDVKLQNLKQLPEPPSARSQDDSSSSSGRDTKTSQDDELSPLVRLSSSSGVSPESRGGKSTASNGCLSLTEYKIYKTDGLADASTQTEETTKANKARETCTRGVSTDDMASEALSSCVKESSEIQIDPSPPFSSTTCSSMGKTETLENLIKADASKYYSFRRLEESQTSVNSKLKATDMLLQLISCGSISVKDHSFGLIPSYKPRFSDSKFPSPLFSTSVMLGNLDCYPDNNSRFTSMRLEDKEYFSASLVDAKLLKDEGVASLKRSASYNAVRTNNDNHALDKEENKTLAKCIPKSLKPSLGKHPKNELMKSPVSEGPRISSEASSSSRVVSPSPSNGSSKRITTDPCSSKKHSGRLESFREEKENMIKIEESLLQEQGLSSTQMQFMILNVTNL